MKLRQSKRTRGPPNVVRMLASVRRCKAGSQKMCGRGGRESEGGSAPNCHWDTDLEPAIRQHLSGTRCVWIERNDEALVQISKASEAAKVSSSAVGVAQKTIGPASSPSDSSAEFGEVIKVITSIRSANELAGLERNDRGSTLGSSGERRWWPMR